MNTKDVQQRIVAILTARLAGDTSTEERLRNEILRDDKLLSATCASAIRFTEDTIKILADDRKKSPEEMLRIIALIVAGHEDEEF
jgi:hypothetical protein